MSFIRAVLWLACSGHTHGVSACNTPVLVTTAPLSSKSHRLWEKRQSLMEKLLPRSLRPKDAARPLPEEKQQRAGLTKTQTPLHKPAMSVKQQQSDGANEGVMERVEEALHSTAEEHMTSASAGSAAGGRLFVFRDPPESFDSASVQKRKKKRNFLNLKKSSVAPTNLP